MKFVDRLKLATQAFTSKNSLNDRNLARDFLRNGNNKPLVQDWSKVIMNDEESYTGYSYAAINKRANKVAYLALNNIKTRGTKQAMDAARAKEEELKHPYLSVIDESPTFSNFKFWHDIAAYLDLEGVYYLMVIRNFANDGSNTRYGNIQAFKMLNPYNIRRIKNKETLAIGGYVEAREGLVREIPPEMIIEIRDLNPFNEDDPFSMIDAAKGSQYTLKQAGDYTRHSLKNNMAAPGIISTDMLLEPEQFSNFVSRVTNQEKGLPLFGNGVGAITWDSMQIDLDKAALDKINEINRSELFAVSGVGKTNMAIEESGTTRETAKVQKDILTEDQIMPRLQSILDAFNQDYKNNYSNEYSKNKFEMYLDNPLGSDREAELKDIQIRKDSLSLYDSLVAMGYSRELSAKYANGEITLEELGEPTEEPRPNPVVEAAMLKAGDTPKNTNLEPPKEDSKKKENLLDKEENKGNPHHDDKGRFTTGPYSSGIHEPTKDLKVDKNYKATYKKIDGDPKQFIMDNFQVPNMIITEYPEGKHKDTVEFFRKRIRENKVIPPITARKVPGTEGTFADTKISIDDGFHRTQAFYLEKKIPPVTLFEIDQADESRAYMDKWLEANQWWSKLNVDQNKESITGEVKSVHTNKEAIKPELKEENAGNPHHDDKGRFTTGPALSDDELYDAVKHIKVGEYDWRNKIGSAAVEAIAKKRKFNRKPKVLEDADYEKLTSDTHFKQYRGVREDENASKHREALIRGEYHAGDGDYGSGIYTSSDKFYAHGFTYSHGNSGPIQKIALPKDAKIIDIHSSWDGKPGASDLAFEELRKSKYYEPSNDKEELMGALKSNPGVWAANNGYDAIRIHRSSFNGSDEIDNFNILNRSILTMSNEMEEVEL